MTLPKRSQGYISISNTLASMSNSQLQQALSTGKVMHTGIGGTSVQINVEDIPVFVKKFLSLSSS